MLDVLRPARGILFSLLATSALIAPPAWAGKVGQQFQVNVVAKDEQRNASVSSYAGGFVVAWQSGFHPGGQYDVFMRLYKSNGTPRDTQRRVNTFATGHQIEPKIARLTDGSFVICWASFLQDTQGYGVYCQRYDRRGEKVGRNFRVNTNIVMNQFQIGLAALDNATFVVVWKDEGAPGGWARIGGQRVANDGTPIGAEFYADSNTPNGRSFPQVAGLKGGKFVVVWQSFAQHSSTSGQDIYGQRFNANGRKAGGEFRVNTLTDNEQIAPVVAGLVDGSFVVAWWGRDSLGAGIKAQRYGSNGGKLGGEFLVNTTESSHQVSPSITALVGGGFVAVWHAWHGCCPGSDGFDDINGQAFTASGAKDGPEFRVNTHVPPGDTGIQQMPAVAGRGPGFVVVWESSVLDGDNLGIFAQRFSAP